MSLPKLIVKKRKNYLSQNQDKIYKQKLLLRKLF